jgi:hypothetical protein
VHTNTNISIPDSLSPRPLLSPSANDQRTSFPPSTPPQWLHQANNNRIRILHHPPYLLHNSNQSLQTPTKSHGMAIKCTSPFLPPYLSLTLLSPQVQHLHLGLLQKARLSQDRKRTGRRGRHLSRLQTAYQRSARSSFRVRPPLLSLSLNPSDPLYRWWSVFWVLFQAKNNGAGSEDAMLYHKVPRIRHFH